MSIDPGDSMIDAVREGLSNPAKKHDFICRMMERRNWKTYDIARSRVCHWLDPNHAAEFPARELHEALRSIGHADFLESLLAIEATVLRANRRVRKVEAAPRERRRSA